MLLCLTRSFASYLMHYSVIFGGFHTIKLWEKALEFENATRISHLRLKCQAKSDAIIRLHKNLFAANLWFVSLYFLTLTGRQMIQRRKSAKARLARNTLVGVFIFLCPMIPVMMSKLPITPNKNVKLKWQNLHLFPAVFFSFFYL